MARARKSRRGAAPPGPITVPMYRQLKAEIQALPQQFNTAIKQSPAMMDAFHAMELFRTQMEELEATKAELHDQEAEMSVPDAEVFRSWEGVFAIAMQMDGPRLTRAGLTVRYLKSLIRRSRKHGPTGHILEGIMKQMYRENHDMNHSDRIRHMTRILDETINLFENAMNVNDALREDLALTNVARFRGVLESTANALLTLVDTMLPEIKKKEEEEREEEEEWEEERVPTPEPEKEPRHPKKEVSSTLRLLIGIVATCMVGIIAVWFGARSMDMDLMLELKKTGVFATAHKFLSAIVAKICSIVVNHIAPAMSGILGTMVDWLTSTISSVISFTLESLWKVSMAIAEGSGFYYGHRIVSNVIYYSILCTSFLLMLATFTASIFTRFSSILSTTKFLMLTLSKLTPIGFVTSFIS